MRPVALSFVVVGLFAFGASSAFAGSVTFHSGVGTAVTGDLGFQAAVTGAGGVVHESDLNSLLHGARVSSILVGPETIDVDLTTGGVFVDGTAEAFAGSFGGGGGVYGTVDGTALLNRTAAGGATTQMTFLFASPVYGFGIWIFDNSSASSDSFRAIVTEDGGEVSVSSILDANPGSAAHTVEGFLGATSPIGITSFTIEVGASSLAGFTPHAISFELDHPQVGIAPLAAAAPLPAGAWAGFGMLAGLAALRSLRRRAAVRA